jgi:hypothetical protein
MEEGGWKATRATDATDSTWTDAPRKPKTPEIRRIYSNLTGRRLSFVNSRHIVTSSHFDHY